MVSRGNCTPKLNCNNFSSALEVTLLLRPLNMLSVTVVVVVWNCYLFVVYVVANCVVGTGRLDEDQRFTESRAD